MNKTQKLTLGAAAAGTIGTFLPWISVSAGAFGYSVSESRNGFHGAGTLFFILMVAMGIIAFAANQAAALQKNLRLITMVTGGFCALLVIIAYNNVSGQIGGGYGVVKASMGFGLILSFLASAALVAIPIVLKQPGESLAADFAGLKTSVQAIQGNLAKPAVPAPAPPPAKQNRMDELEKLITWRNEGKISQEEFEVLKSKII